MSQAVAVAERYIAAWNETNPTARKEALSADWVQSAVYRYPMPTPKALV